MEQIGEERWDKWRLGSSRDDLFAFLLSHWIFQLTLMSFLSVFIYTCCPLTNSCQVVQVPRWEEGRAPLFLNIVSYLKG
jgi:hypothetical protein